MNNFSASTWRPTTIWRGCLPRTLFRLTKIVFVSFPETGNLTSVLSPLIPMLSDFVEASSSSWSELTDASLFFFYFIAFDIPRLIYSYKFPEKRNIFRVRIVMTHSMLLIGQWERTNLLFAFQTFKGFIFLSENFEFNNEWKTNLDSHDFSYCSFKEKSFFSLTHLKKSNSSEKTFSHRFFLSFISSMKVCF